MSRSPSSQAPAMSLHDVSHSVVAWSSESDRPPSINDNDESCTVGFSFAPDRCVATNPMTLPSAAIDDKVRDDTNLVGRPDTTICAATSTPTVNGPMLLSRSATAPAVSLMRQLVPVRFVGKQPPLNTPDHRKGRNVRATTHTPRP
jgi:hypothetical protein